MAKVNAKLTESVIRQIMEGTDPRAAIDSALDEKAGYHKEKRIRDGKAQVVNVKNVKKKVHHTLTPDQKKAIKKAHSAAANRKRAKSLKKGAKMGLYKESMQIMSEEDVELKGLAIACPACGAGSLEIVDGTEEDGVVLVCPECGETFVICATSEIEEVEEEDKDEDEEETEEEEQAEAVEEDEEVAAEETEEDAETEETEVEAEVGETEEDAQEEFGEEEVEADETEEAETEEEETEEEEPEEESGLFFAAED